MPILTKDELLELLKTNDRAVERAVLAIYERQTTDEQRDKETKEHNTIGFNGPDSKLLSSFAEQLKRGRHLTTERKFGGKQPQMYYAREKILKYWRQLLEIAEEKRLTNLDKLEREHVPLTDEQNAQLTEIAKHQYKYGVEYPGEDSAEDDIRAEYGGG